VKADKTPGKRRQNSNHFRNWLRYTATAIGPPHQVLGDVARLPRAISTGLATWLRHQHQRRYRQWSIEQSPNQDRFVLAAELGRTTDAQHQSRVAAAMSPTQRNGIRSREFFDVWTARIRHGRELDCRDGDVVLRPLPSGKAPKTHPFFGTRSVSRKRIHNRGIAPGATTDEKRLLGVRRKSNVFRDAVLCAGLPCVLSESEFRWRGGRKARSSAT
jgi:hypothetical protein